MPRRSARSPGDSSPLLLQDPGATAEAVFDRVDVVVVRRDLALHLIAVEGPLLVPLLVAIEVDLQTIGLRVARVLVDVDLPFFRGERVLDLVAARDRLARFFQDA